MAGSPGFGLRFPDGDGYWGRWWKLLAKPNALVIVSINDGLFGDVTEVSVIAVSGIDPIWQSRVEAGRISS